MTTIYHDDDADPGALDGQSVTVVGYGNQGRSWALNLRDSCLDPQVCVRDDETRAQAEAEGFAAADIEAASAADVVCILVPDDAIAGLPLERPDDGLTIVASGYTLAYERFTPAGDVAMVAPRMLGPEVRRCYEESIGFITAVGVQEDRTGTALARTLAVARAIGGLKQGGIELTPTQEAVLDLSVEQVLSPILTHAHTAWVLLMLEQGIPFEAIMTELTLSGEVERSYRLLREEGYVRQLDYHSPTSQYGQLSRRDRFSAVDVLTTMRELLDDITSGRFADEWDAEAAAGHPTLEALRAEYAGPELAEMERRMREVLGAGAS
jgi:ketol-acid reductoisomerase